jgi:hypothetical protein
LERVDLLKVDVEGMKLDVLSGADQTIRRSLPHIIFETLRALAPEHHRPIELHLRSLGYITYGLNYKTARFEEIRYPNYPQDNSYAIHPYRANLERRQEDPVTAAREPNVLRSGTHRQSRLERLAYYTSLISFGMKGTPARLMKNIEWT